MARAVRSAGMRASVYLESTQRYKLGGIATADTYDVEKGRLKGSEVSCVESTRKVPTSHYHTKHCHAAVVSLGGCFCAKGSVESTHKVPTSHYLYHTKHCLASVIGKNVGCMYPFSLTFATGDIAMTSTCASTAAEVS